MSNTKKPSMILLLALTISITIPINPMTEFSTNNASYYVYAEEAVQTRLKDAIHTAYGNGTNTITFGLPEFVFDQDNNLYINAIVAETTTEVLVKSGITFSVSKIDCSMTTLDENGFMITKDTVNVFHTDDVTKDSWERYSINDEQCETTITNDETRVVVTTKKSDLNGFVFETRYTKLAENDFVKSDYIFTMGKTDEKIVGIFKTTETTEISDLILGEDRYELQESTIEQKDLTGLVKKTVEKHSKTNDELLDKTITFKNDDKVKIIYDETLADSDLSDISVNTINGKLGIETRYVSSKPLSETEQFVIDPTFSSQPNLRRVLTTSTTGTSCGSPNSNSAESGQFFITTSTNNDSCGRVYQVIDPTSIPSNALISKVEIGGIDITQTLGRNCDINLLSADARSQSAADAWNNIGGGTSLVSNSAVCASNNIVTIDLGSAAVSDMQTAVSTSRSWFGQGWKYTNETRDSNNHITTLRQEGSTSNQRYWLTVTYSTVPDPPTSLGITTISTTRLDLSWTAPANNGGSVITGYKIERQTHTSGCTGGSMTTLVTNTGTISTTYSDTSASSNTCYSYRVSAINSVGTGNPSTTASGTTIPAAPTNLTVLAVSTSQIDLSWTTPTGNVVITGYKIERESPIGNGFSTLVVDTGTSSTTYSDSGLMSNTQYNYRVSAINAGGVSSASNASNDTTDEALPPTNLNAVTISHTEIDLSWTAPVGTVIGYKIERESPIGNGFSVLVANTTTSSTIYSDSGLMSNTQYNYRISSIYSGGTSVPSTATANITGASAPTSFTATPISSSQIDLSWVTPSLSATSITGYRIFFSSDGTVFTTLENNTGSTSTSYSHTAIPVGATRHYKIAAINSFGAGANSTITSATTQVSVLLSSGGAGGGFSSPQTPVGFTPVKLSVFEDSLTAKLGEITTRSIRVSWDNGENLQVNLIKIGESPLKISFTRTPLLLQGSGDDKSTDSISYTIQIPDQYCTESIFYNCVENTIYRIPITIYAVKAGVEYTQDTTITIDLTNKIDYALVTLIGMVGIAVVGVVKLMAKKPKERYTIHVKKIKKGTRQRFIKKLLADMKE